MDFETYLTETIQSAVKEAISNEFKDEIFGLIRSAIEQPYMTTDGVMEMTGWSRRTIQYLRDTRQIDFVQHGRKILYPTKAFYEFLETCRIQRRLEK